MRAVYQVQAMEEDEFAKRIDIKECRARMMEMPARIVPQQLLHFSCIGNLQRIRREVTGFKDCGTKNEVKRSNELAAQNHHECHNEDH